MAFFVGGILQRKIKKFYPWRLVIFGVGIVAAVMFFLWKWFFNSLPSDEYMIDHFKKNRAAYEELVAGYIDAQSRDNDAMKSWMDSPRKMELQRLVKAKDEMVGPESSRWYGGVIPLLNSKDGKKFIYSMEFHIEGGSAYSFREKSVVWKSYWYYPIPPEITASNFCKMTSRAEKCFARTMTGILPGLDSYPLFPDSEPWCGSYARQIDTQWFIGYTKACL